MRVVWRWHPLRNPEVPSTRLWPNSSKDARTQPSAASIPSAVAWPIEGIQCEYVSKVSFRLLCPSSCWT